MNILQFEMAKTVAAAANVDGIKPRALASGVADVRFGTNTKNARSGHTRVTCSVAMARFLIEELRLVAALADSRKDGELLIDTALAVKAATDAIAEGTHDDDAAGGIDPTPY
jgi:hypothetical protein